MAMVRFLLFAFAFAVPFAHHVGAAPPNILVIVADNQGWKDIGYNGSEIKTPTLDKLATEGVRLDHFYVYSMCSPTRAAFVSGRAPSRYNINGAIGNRSRQSLPVDTVTIADTLKAVGYDTAIAGKWHLGLRPDVGPLQYGFDSSYGFLHGQIDKRTHRYKNGDPSWHRNDQFSDEEGHSLDLITNEAIRVVQEQRDAPFFLYVPFGAPHPPLQEDSTWTAMYEGKIASESRRLYAAATTHMDDAVGRIVDAVEESGQRDNTLIVFFSDNGAIENWPEQTKNYDGRFGPYPVLGDNGYLRGWIGDLYDGCLRTPAFLNWPAKLKPRVLDNVTSVLDLYPTLTAVAGGTVATDLKLEGRNIWPLISNGVEPPEIVLYWKNYNGKKLALRRGRWKLHTGADGSIELFDMVADPGERSNLAAENPDVVAELRKSVEAEAALDQNE